MASGLSGGGQEAPRAPRRRAVRVAAAGVEGWECSLPSADVAGQLARLLPKHGLAMRSMYANSRLHTDDWPRAVEQVVEQARWAKPLGVQVLVTNPEPIRWGGTEDKSDAELRTQARALQTLGERLAAEGVRLAYHTHDPEMRAAAREFHHMLRATDPAVVGLCLDAHWIWRGAGNSQVALDDVIGMYFDRICSLHVRQSRGGTWIQTLADGDIDYRPLAARLRQSGFAGPIIIEVAREKGTDLTANPIDAQRQARQWVRDIFDA